jgi:hypothetical protein
MAIFLCVFSLAFLTYFAGMILSHYVMCRRGNGDDFLVMLSFLFWPAALLISVCRPSEAAYIVNFDVDKASDSF